MVVTIQVICDNYYNHAIIIFHIDAVFLQYIMKLFSSKMMDDLQQQFRQVL